MTCALKSSSFKDMLSAFCMGRLYPPVVALLISVGSILNIEIYTAMAHVILIAVAFLTSKSIRPILFSLVTFVMHVSIQHAPAHPTKSDYYYTGWRLPVVIIMASSVVAFFIYFAVKQKIYRKVSFKNTPLLFPIILLSAAFLLNGLFSTKWTVGSLVMGCANVFVYAFLFITIFHAISEESAEDLGRYFAYISAIAAFIIISEMTALYLSGRVFVNGELIKVNVALGWGIWNIIGVSLAVLIPILFYGVHNNSCPWFYFGTATLTYIFAVLSQSRNALIFATLAYVACVIISCFKGKNKKAFRVLTVIGIAACIAFALVFREQIFEALKKAILLGDNKRFKLWGAAFDNFLEAPMFGNGFYGFEVDDELLFSFGLQNKQAHNTVLQLLSATGIAGLFAYLYYRYSSLKPIFKRPTLKKTFITMSIAVLLLESLLDNFVFNIYPMFYYTVALAILHKFSEEENYG